MRKSRRTALPPATAQATFYRPELDALRFFAFFCVLFRHLPLQHAHWAPFSVAGAFGVSLFFVLSAYLLLTLLLQERETRGRVAWGAFAARRMLRIWPLYFVTVGIAWALGHFRPETHFTGKALAYLLLLSGNIFIMRFGWRLPPTVSMLWSISVEEQFYLGLPLLARASRRVIAAVCCIAIVIAYIKLAIFQSRGLQWVTVWTDSFAQFQFFAVGALIALHSWGRSQDRPVAARVCLFVGGLAMWLSAYRHDVLGIFALDLLGTVAIFYSILGIKATSRRLCDTSAGSPMDCMCFMSSGSGQCSSGPAHGLCHTKQLAWFLYWGELS